MSLSAFWWRELEVTVLLLSKGLYNAVQQSDVEVQVTQNLLSFRVCPFFVLANLT